MSYYLPFRSLSGAAPLLLRDNILILPLHEPARYRNTLRPQVQFINREISNIFRNGSLPSPSVILNLPQPCRLQGLCHRWPFLSPLLDFPIWYPCDTPSQSMVEPFQHLQHRIHHYPTLTPVKQHNLNYRLVHRCLCLHHCPHIFQRLCHHPLLPLHLHHISV